MSSVDEGRIAALIRSFSDHEPPFSSLGTAFFVDTETTRRLVEFGAKAVSQLIEGLNAPDPKVAIYCAYCLRQIGDRAALPALREARERYLAHEPKGEYDFSVISAIGQSEEALNR